MKNIDKFLKESLMCESEADFKNFNKMKDALIKYNDKLNKKYIPVLVNQELNPDWLVQATDEFWDEENENKNINDWWGSGVEKGEFREDLTLKEMFDFFSNIADEIYDYGNNFKSWDQFFKSELPKYRK